jgi:mono/diheme cytochrome c family protein
LTSLPQDGAAATGTTPAGGAQDGGAAPAVPEPDWMTQFPEGVEVSLATLNRGQARFEIYCSVCHGYDGNGGGLVNQRALALNVNGKAAWTEAKSLHDPTIKVQPVGRIFDTISNGRGTMGPYHSQIPIADRWAIVMYVKALQETGIQPKQAVVKQ